MLLLSPSGFSPLFLGSIAEELASHGYVVVGSTDTYETAVTVFSDGHVATMNPAALGGALGPQIGPHDAAFRRRAEVCNYKAADLRFVADHLSRLGPNGAGLTGGHLDLTSVGAFGHSLGGNAALSEVPRRRTVPSLGQPRRGDLDRGRHGRPARPALQSSLTTPSSR